MANNKVTPSKDRSIKNLEKDMNLMNQVNTHNLF